MSNIIDTDMGPDIEAIEFIRATRAKLIPKWEATGLLENTDAIHRGTMAQLLENQMGIMTYMTNAYNDPTTPWSKREPSIPLLASIMLPLVVRVYGPIISSIGSMSHPASLSDSGWPILARSIQLPTPIPMLRETDLRPFHNDHNVDYVEAISKVILADINSYIAERENKLGEEVKYYVYIPFKFYSMKRIDDAEFKYNNYKVVVRGAITTHFKTNAQDN